MKHTISITAALIAVTLLGAGSYAAPGAHPSEPRCVNCPGIVLECIPPEQIVKTPQGCLACGTPYT
ncbi:hypothetical protein K443DRAFT_359636 [Laccaria amethystina LaAM-08-1]|uniref:Uncharacterized protein n=1 Tax=Laccaria amethystina LaAM-08-1 TaxID=1095629 RepID=A0A0C9XUC3_9AGAR|nr:hypothetical protein K443DRAFT_359636 [Laccaria amethystina LaAM-08-1]